MTPLHPLLTHMPIGLLVAAACIDLVALAMHPQSTFRHVATWLYLAGAVSLIATYFSGRADAETMRIPGMAHSVVNEHWEWAFRTTVYMNIVSVFRLAIVRSGWLISRLRWAPVIAAGLIGIVLLFQTAERGGRLVYQYGVGIAQVD